MLTQLALAGILGRVAGVVFGQCTNCTNPGSNYGNFTIYEVLEQHFAPLGVPAFQGALIGHIANPTLGESTGLAAAAELAGARWIGFADAFWWRDVWMTLARVADYPFLNHGGRPSPPCRCVRPIFRM